MVWYLAGARRYSLLHVWTDCVAHQAVPWGLGVLAVCALCEIDSCAMLKMHLYILINSRHTVLYNLSCMLVEEILCNVS